MPAAQSSRQEVMNAGPHHAKLRVTAHVASPVYVAGSEISGKIDVECRAEKGLGLGTIVVELMAFQELNSRDHAATSTFIHTRRVFQGPGLPPSNAVLPEDEKGIFPPHHFPARRGITTFFFRFPLPLTSPASVDFGSGLAKIRYEIRASASVAWKGERRLVTDSQEVQVVESAMQEVESAGTVVGESGKIWVQGKVLGGAVIAGQTCCIELHVKNHSPRKTTGVNVTLQRMLHLDNPPPQHANLILSDTLVNAAFHSAEYCCPPGLEGVAKLVINVPRTARTVKGGSRESGETGAEKAIPALFDIRGTVNVRLCMGAGAKDLVLNLPVVISHPAALAAEAQSLGLPNQDLAQMRANSPHTLYDPPRSPFLPSQSPVLSLPTGYSSYPLAASPTLPYTQLYFPPPSPQLPQILNQFPAPPTSPGLPMSPILPMSPGHHMSPVLPMSPVHPMSPVLPPAPSLPMSPSRSMSPVLPYPQTMSPVHSYQNQSPFQQPQVYSPPRTPVHPASRSPQSPRRALPQPPQRKPQAKPKGPAPHPPPLPPRPTSAEPHVHEVGVDLPPSGDTPLSPSAGRIQAATEVPDPVEGKGTRALRISEHLKMSSRTRSMSPTGRRFPGPQSRPAPFEPPSPEVAADLEPGVLSPRPVHTTLAEAVGRAGSADGSVTKTQVQDLERIAVEDEVETASIRGAKEAQRVDRKSPERSPRKSEQSQPPPGPRGGRENRSPGRALPRLPPRAGGEPRNTPPTSRVGLGDEPPTSPKKLPQSASAPVVTSKVNNPPAPVVKPLQPVSTGLTALERRLTTKMEHPPLPSSPIRKSVQQQEQSAPSPKEEPTIDWGEIARVGKLKAFASANKKPTIPAFAVPEIPSTSFARPKPTVVRKPVPSMYGEEDLPILPEHRTPANSHPPSPRNAPVSTPAVEARPLVRYELTDNPMPRVETESGPPKPLASPAQSPVQSPTRPAAQLPSQPSAQPRSFPIAPQSSQESHRKAPGSPSRPKPESRPASFQSAVPVHMASPDSHPPSPRAAASPTAETKPLVRYELSDNPVPKVSSQPGTPRSSTNTVQLPSQPAAQPTRVPVQRASVPIPSRPSQDQFPLPVSTPPQSRPSSRPASVVVTSSPATETKPLVRYELTDKPVPKASPRPKAPELVPAPVRIPVQAPTQQSKTQASSWPRPVGRPQSVAAPADSEAQGGSRHTAFVVSSSPVIETQPLGPSDLAYEPISFTQAEPTLPVTTRDVPQSPVRSPPSSANAGQLPREDASQPIVSPTRPKAESRSQSQAPATSPAVPDHVPRYQLSDGPISKPPVRYQLEDSPIPKPPTTSPASAPISGPEAILTNHRANLRPVSSAKPPQPKVRPRTPPSPIPAASIPLPQSPTKVAVPSRPVATSRPLPSPFPRLEGRPISTVPALSTQPTSPKRRDPSPRRSRPQDPPPQPAISSEGDVFGGEQRIVSNPQRAELESQAAQKAKYFESLAAAKRGSSPEKPQPAPQNTRQVIQPHQANGSQPNMGTRYAQVQIQPPPSQPKSPPRATPIRTAPSPLEISAPRRIPSPRISHASPVLGYNAPLRSPSPVFTANPVAPTLPTARSLIPITSSGFEVPAVLPGRDARERADAALREAELFRLKREAITRVPMWLGNEYTPQAPPPTRVVRSFNAAELPPQLYWDIQQPEHEELSMADLLSRESTPVSRAAYDPQLKHPRPRPVSSKPPPALLPSDRELMDKYNAQQSARGGRGGQVTAVTSIWENTKGDPTPAAGAERKHQAKRYTAPVGMFGITAKGVLPNEGTNLGMAKSTSVPAMVHPSQAIPVLSSTASLARPIGGQGTRTRMMPFAPSIPESQSDDALIRKTSQSLDNIPVGQARLKELIGKYQS